MLCPLCTSRRTQWLAGEAQWRQIWSNIWDKNQCHLPEHDRFWTDHYHSCVRTWGCDSTVKTSTWCTSAVKKASEMWAIIRKGWRRKGRALLCCWVNPYLAHISHDMYSSGIPILQDLYEAGKDSEKHLRYNQCEKLILYQERLSWKLSVQTRDNLGKKQRNAAEVCKSCFCHGNVC